MSDNFFDPHFNSFPPSEPGEEVNFFNFFILFLLFQPVMQIDKLNRLSTQIVAETFLADRIIFKVGVLVFSPNILIIDDLQLVQVSRLWSRK